MKKTETAIPRVEGTLIYDTLEIMRNYYFKELGEKIKKGIKERKKIRGQKV